MAWAFFKEKDIKVALLFAVVGLYINTDAG
jgi:hypothetical protein